MTLWVIDLFGDLGLIPADDPSVALIDSLLQHWDIRVLECTSLLMHDSWRACRLQ